MASPLIVSQADLTASHRYTRDHFVADQRFHGGFLEDDSYAPPRTLVRTPAIEAWCDALERRGWPLVDCSPTERPQDVFPSLDQQRFLFSHNVRQSFWDELTIIAVNEGRGEAMCYVNPIALQEIIEEGISETITGHLWKGLFWAHGVDEAGDRSTPDIGGHKHMWLAARDLLFGKDAFFPPPPVPRMHSRPKMQPREIPVLAQDVEKLFESCMAVLHVECRAYAHFKLCLDLCREPHLFDRPADDVRLAAEIIARIQEDEASHVAYLRGLYSELRSFTFRDGVGGRWQGADLLDPIWERQLAWPDLQARAQRRAHTMGVIEAEARAKLGSARAGTVINDMRSLASEREGVPAGA